VDGLRNNAIISEGNNTGTIKDIKQS